ncbi:hypothetical protein [Luteimonas fraxinea]|uniref:DUF4760 domain-containing protein n=1 Tax=Luteimonas fraxinea TaxID=2901869 RepID=A0ABS8UBS2_9GAMM|nr:hypothetical protein [Luteimonas fraxinea]MCD9096169.1 hypothetical protein [Luteimonas fraxinea]
MEDPIYCLTVLGWPCATADIWSSSAAWAQAVLSALAIYAASRLAYRQARAGDAKRVRSMQLLLEHTWHSQSLILEDAKKRRDGTKTGLISPAPLKACIEALDAIQIGQIPDYRLYSPITFGRANARLAIDYLDRLNEAIASGVTVTEMQIQALERLEGELGRYRHDIRDIELSYRPWLAQKYELLRRRIRR